jgi:hypothetical protein
MAKHMRPRSSARVMADLAQQASTERHWQYQVWRERAGSGTGPRPLEFDENGFPIPQPVSGFVQRVGRLINGT